MHSQILGQIDKIEALDPERCADVQIYNMLAGFAQGSDELRILVERYGASRSLPLVRELAHLVLRQTHIPVAEVAPLVFVLIEKLYWKNDVQILQCCLQAINLHLLHGYTWIVTDRPAVLPSFLRHCLNFASSLQYSALVQFDAIQVIARLYESELLEHTFTIMQHTWLHDKLLHVAMLRNDLLEDTLEWLLPEIAKQEHLAAHSSIIRRLDNIERLSENDPGALTEEAFHLIRTFGQGPEELWVLVERYGGAQSIAVLYALTRILAEVRAGGTTPLICYLTEQLRREDDPIILGQCLAAIKQQLHLNDVWNPAVQPPAGLYPFVIHCLSYCLRYPDIAQKEVQSVLLDVLALLYHSGLLRDAFDLAQRTMIRDKVLQVVSVYAEFPPTNVAWTFEFSQHQDLFVQPSVLERLDVIEQSTSETTIDEETLILLAAFGQELQDLQTVIHRYGKSRNRAVMGALALVVSMRAASSKLNMLPLSLLMIEQLQSEDDVLVLTNILMALRQQFIFDHTLEFSAHQSQILYAFVIQCLSHDNASVQAAVLEVLIILHRKNMLMQIFVPDQLSSLSRLVISVVENGGSAWGTVSDLDVKRLLQYFGYDTYK